MCRHTMMEALTPLPPRADAAAVALTTLLTCGFSAVKCSTFQEGLTIDPFFSST
jgi:hypothetical protein